MSTPIPINADAVSLVKEAAHETHTVDGLEALRLVLEKMHGKPGLITDHKTFAAACRYVENKMAALVGAE